MTTQNLNLFNALYANMNYLGQKQRVIAENIANADTAGYQAQELKGAPNFKAILGDVRHSSGIDSPALDATSGAHMDMGGRRLDATSKTFKNQAQKSTYEISPSGNSVIIEEQMIKASETVAEHRLMSNIHEKYLGMLRAATGNGR